MIKKYISGENLVYVLDKFEQKIRSMVESINNIITANDGDVNEIFGINK